MLRFLLCFLLAVPSSTFASYQSEDEEKTEHTKETAIAGAAIVAAFGATICLGRPRCVRAFQDAVAHTKSQFIRSHSKWLWNIHDIEISSNIPSSPEPGLWGPLNLSPRMKERVFAFHPELKKKKLLGSYELNESHWMVWPKTLRSRLRPNVKAKYYKAGNDGVWSEVGDINDFGKSRIMMGIHPHHRHIHFKIRLDDVVEDQLVEPVEFVVDYPPYRDPQFIENFEPVIPLAIIEKIEKHHLAVPASDIFENQVTDGAGIIGEHGSFFIEFITGLRFLDEVDPRIHNAYRDPDSNRYFRFKKKIKTDT